MIKVQYDPSTFFFGTQGSRINLFQSFFPSRLLSIKSSITNIRRSRPKAVTFSREGESGKTWRLRHPEEFGCSQRAGGQDSGQTIKRQATMKVQLGLGQ